MLHRVNVIFNGDCVENIGDKKIFFGVSFRQQSGLVHEKNPSI
jgi:hypothetical protein